MFSGRLWRAVLIVLLFHAALKYSGMKGKGYLGWSGPEYFNPQVAALSALSTDLQHAVLVIFVCFFQARN